MDILRKVKANADISADGSDVRSMNLVTHNAASGRDPDADLIKAISQGDKTAFSQLMDRHLSHIVALAAHMLGDRFAAEDVAQTVFLKTWQMIPRWKTGNAKLITWMRKVATNQCLDILRSKREVYSDSLPDSEDQSPSAIDYLEIRDRSLLVREAMQSLPDRQRAAISLSYFQHVSQKEGSVILAISESAYESLLVRARKSLRATLSQNPNTLLATGVGL